MLESGCYRIWSLTLTLLPTPLRGSDRFYPCCVKVVTIVFRSPRSTGGGLDPVGKTTTSAVPVPASVHRVPRTRDSTRVAPTICIFGRKVFSPPTLYSFPIFYWSTHVTSDRPIVQVIFGLGVSYTLYESIVCTCTWA